MTTCAVHRPAVNQSGGRPRSRFYEIAHRVADRFEPETAAAFAAAVERLRRQIDEAALRSAIASGSVDAITAAVATGGSLRSILEARDLENALRRTSAATGRAGADVLSDVTGATARFNVMHPDVVLRAREQAGRLVVSVSEDVVEAIRIVVALGQSEGLTVVQQARAIREVVGLPPNWAAAPFNLRQEILNGHAAAATSRRLSATDKAQIRSRIANGTVSETFADRMQGRYADSLVNRRARNIARTENLEAAHHGQHSGWKQAVGDGVLPATARRIVIVTPDDRLEHWMVPGMNEGGRGMDEYFQAPEGAFLHPPFRPNCFLPWTEMQGRFVGGLRAWYDGPCVVVSTTKGRELAVTANHPAITQRGRVAASDLRKGDKLIGYARDGHATGTADHKHLAPASAEEVFDSLQVAFGRSAGGRRVVLDLDGDEGFIHGDVDIVGADGLLAGDRDAPPTQLVRKRLLVGPAMQEASLSGDRASTFSPVGFATAAAAAPRSAELPGDPAGSFLDLLPLEQFGFGAAADLNSFTLQGGPDGCAVAPESLGEAFLGHPPPVQRDELVGWQRDPVGVIGAPANFRLRGESKLNTPVPHRRSANPKLFREILEAHSGVVELDEVISVDVFSWSGHVYDLQAVPGWCFASNVAVFQCRCGVGLIFPGYEGVL